jgi:SAM-dependent methyltransferase
MPSRTPPLSFSASLRLPIIAKHLERANPTSVVEVGCGLGAMAYRLASEFDYRGYEPDQTSCEVAAHRLAELGHGEVRNDRLPVQPDRRFGALCAFEVLEHIEDDSTALIDWVRWVEPGGVVILSVPADPERYGASDEAVGHYRRYTRGRLYEVMETAGIDVVAIDAWGMPLGYLLEAARNMVLANHQSGGQIHERTAQSGRLYQPSGPLGRLPELATWPFTYLQRPFAKTDFGIGYVAVGRPGL